MRVLVGCEFSGTVRDAFARRGHDAWSCDLLETERPGQHIVGDVRDHLRDGWDLAVFHPPCTDLAVSGARWFKAKAEKQEAALAFVRELWNAPIRKVAVEQPVSKAADVLGPAHQTIHPWQFGHGERKTTCLWLRGLPKLYPTKVVPGREARIHRMAPGPDRWRERSRTYPGIAEAMAAQWSATLDLLEVPALG